MLLCLVRLELIYKKKEKITADTCQTRTNSGALTHTLHQTRKVRINHWPPIVYPHFSHGTGQTVKYSSPPLSKGDLFQEAPPPQWLPGTMGGTEHCICYVSAYTPTFSLKGSILQLLLNCQHHCSCPLGPLLSKSYLTTSTVIPQQLIWEPKQLLND